MFQTFVFDQQTFLFGMLYQLLPQVPQLSPASIGPFDFAPLFGVQALEFSTIGLHCIIAGFKNEQHAIMHTFAVRQWGSLTCLPSCCSQIGFHLSLDAQYPIGFGVMENSNCTS